MKNNKKILLIILLILIIVIIIVFSNSTEKVVKATIKDEIAEKINNKDSFIIYLTSSDNACYLCIDADVYLDYYQKLYNFEVKKINLDKITSKEYELLAEFLGETEFYLNPPAIIIIKDGQKVLVTAELLFESFLKRMLIKYEFIPENIHEKEIGDDDLTFEQVYSSTDKQIILVYNYIQTTYDIKKILVELSNEYKFTYNLLYHGRDSYSEDYLRIRQTFKKKNIPIMLIVQDSQVIDYSTELNTKEEIINFLKKNEIINN